MTRMMNTWVQAIVALAIATAATTARAYDWPQFNGDAQKSGNNAFEHKISRYTVNQLVRKWQVTLPGNPDGSPVVLENVPTAAGITTVVFVNTRAGHLLAYDARNGTQLWSKQHTGVNDMASSPAIDPNRQYVYTYGLDGRVYKHAVGDGAEITTGGWPQFATLKPGVEKHGGALAVATVGNTSYLYAVHGGYPGDQGDYQGHVTTIDLASGLQKVFNATCSNVAAHLALNDARCTTRQNAVWARPGVVFHAPTNRVLLATGNAFGNNGNTGVSGGFDWSESILAITPDGAGAAGKPIDSYTPANWLALDLADADLGSTAPVILNTPAGSSIPFVGMQGGKDGLLRLFNIANLSGQGGPGHTGGEFGTIGIPQGGALLAQPATWVNPVDQSSWTFVANGSGISGIKVFANGGVPALSPQWTSGISGASPMVANDVVFATGSQVRAFSAVPPSPPTAEILWSTTSAGGAHFHSPAVANGELYVTDASNRLTAYFLPGPKRDMNGDTRDDIVWRETATGNVGLFLMNGATAQWAPVGASSTAWQVAGVGDFDGDGRGDILWRNPATGDLGVWFMNGAGARWVYLGGSSTAWQVAGIGDFNGDGRSDILWREPSTNGVGIFMTNAGGTSFAWSYIGTAAAGWLPAAVGDFDGDGRSDILWREAATGNYGFWFMNGAALTWAFVGGSSTAWQVAGAGDFDGDGRADILWRNPTTGDLGVTLVGVGATTSWHYVGASSTAWQVQRIADYDGDGRADLLWRETATGNLGIDFMNGPLRTFMFVGGTSTGWQVQ